MNIFVLDSDTCYYGYMAIHSVGGSCSTMNVILNIDMMTAQYVYLW